MVPDVRKIFTTRKDLKMYPVYKQISISSDKKKQQLIEYKAMKEDLNASLRIEYGEDKNKIYSE